MDAKQLGAQPAAPFAAYEEEIRVKPTQHSGLTKREHFAGLALQGMLAAEAEGFTYNNPARGAVAHADALLAELAKEGAQ